MGRGCFSCRPGISIPTSVLHSRKAILRGVEDGFSIARAARHGILSISDDRGRVLSERATGSTPLAVLIAAIPVEHEATFYSRFGDWFAWLSLVALVVVIFSLSSPSKPVVAQSASKKPTAVLLRRERAKETVRKP